MRLHLTTVLSRLFLIGCLSALTACATSQPLQPRVEYVSAQVPKTLRACEKAPQWSALVARAKAQQRNATQREVAEFIALLQSAHLDCRTRLAAVDRLIARVEQRARAK